MVFLYNHDGLIIDVFDIWGGTFLRVQNILRRGPPQGRDLAAIGMHGRLGVELLLTEPNIGPMQVAKGRRRNGLRNGGRSQYS